MKRVLIFHVAFVIISLLRSVDVGVAAKRLLFESKQILMRTELEEIPQQRKSRESCVHGAYMKAQNMIAGKGGWWERMF